VLYVFHWFYDVGCEQDELLWAAAWLYQATNNQYYLSYLGNNGDSLGGTGWAMTEFGWDVKYAGVQTLVAKVLLHQTQLLLTQICFSSMLLAQCSDVT
jgi:hypothetical protein